MNPQTSEFCNNALPGVERVLAHAQTLSHLPDRVAPLRDLSDGVLLEIVAELGAAHHGLLASKLAKKPSTIHGAIQQGIRAETGQRCQAWEGPLLKGFRELSMLPTGIAALSFIIYFVEGLGANLATSHRPLGPAGVTDFSTTSAPMLSPPPMASTHLAQGWWS